MVVLPYAVFLSVNKHQSNSTRSWLARLSLLCGKTLRHWNTKGTLSRGLAGITATGQIFVWWQTETVHPGKKKNEKVQFVLLTWGPGVGNPSSMIMERVTHKYVFSVNFSLASPFRLTLLFCLHSWHTDAIDFFSLSYLFTCAEGRLKMRAKEFRYLAAP